mmetsp:Transcript_7881/g.15059  ORF Transcript_7881/g.15059 Transcript_7881/m.15059 type:complete len:248 (+) Transcript_7881:504-1247(+)
MGHFSSPLAHDKHTLNTGRHRVEEQRFQLHFGASVLLLQHCAHLFHHSQLFLQDLHFFAGRQRRRRHCRQRGHGRAVAVAAGALSLDLQSLHLGGDIVNQLLERGQQASQVLLLLQFHFFRSFRLPFFTDVFVFGFLVFAFVIVGIAVFTLRILCLALVLAFVLVIVIVLLLLLFLLLAFVKVSQHERVGDLEFDLLFGSAVCVAEEGDARAEDVVVLHVVESTGRHRRLCFLADLFWKTHRFLAVF